MKRSWLWFVASAVLAVLAGVVAIIALRDAVQRTDVGGEAQPQQYVVVARLPLAAGTTLNAENIALEPRASIPSGAIVNTQDALNKLTLRPIPQGAIILVQDVDSIDVTGTYTTTRNFPFLLGDDKIAVAMPADDIVSKLRAVLPGDHVDLLVTLDIILETPMYPQEVLAAEEGLEIIERDQSLDQASVLALQNLEVLQILQEPQPEAPAPEEGATIEPPLRALILKIDPQDAVILKYLIDSEAKIDIALRSPLNGTLFEVDAVNINYLMLRYGIPLPQPLE